MVSKLPTFILLHIGARPGLLSSKLGSYNSLKPMKMVVYVSIWSRCRGVTDVRGSNYEGNVKIRNSLRSLTANTVE